MRRRLQSPPRHLPGEDDEPPRPRARRPRLAELLPQEASPLVVVIRDLPTRPVDTDAPPAARLLIDAVDLERHSTEVGLGQHRVRSGAEDHVAARVGGVRDRNDVGLAVDRHPDAADGLREQQPEAFVAIELDEPAGGHRPILHHATAGRQPGPSYHPGVPGTTDAGRARLSQLVDAVMAVGSDLDLAATLQRIVEAARQLVDARYCALGVLDRSGGALAEFIVSGIDDATYRSIGDPPKGHGILGLLITDPRPLRLPDLTRHPASFGFPPHHPPMRSFLGVPILVRGEVFGNLYLTDKEPAAAFTNDDEELIIALAASAGAAIDNTRLHARLQEFAVLEDRDRIAMDLHDTVIQQLFAIGLSLQGAARVIEQPDVAARGCSPLSMIWI